MPDAKADQLRAELRSAFASNTNRLDDAIGVCPVTPACAPPGGRRTDKGGRHRNQVLGSRSRKPGLGLGVCVRHALPVAKDAPRGAPSQACLKRSGRAGERHDRFYRRTFSLPDQGVCA